MPLGAIRNLVADRGFAFIQPQDGGEAVFFHRQVMPRIEFDRLELGSVVEYDLGDEATERGPRATRVRLYRGAVEVAMPTGQPFEPLVPHRRARRRKPSWRRDLPAAGA